MACDYDLAIGRLGTSILRPIEPDVFCYCLITSVPSSSGVHASSNFPTHTCTLVITRCPTSQNIVWTVMRLYTFTNNSSYIYIWVSEYTRPNLVVIIIHIMFSLNNKILLLERSKRFCTKSFYSTILLSVIPVYCLMYLLHSSKPQWLSKDHTHTSIGIVQ